MKTLLGCLILFAACVTVPGERHALPVGRAASMFDEMRDQFVMTGAGSVEWSACRAGTPCPASPQHEVTIKDGPGALILPLTDPDYRVRVEAMVEDGGNSGVFVRSKGGIWFPDGVEVQIDPDDPKNPTGSIYGRVRSAAPVPAFGEWFTIEVVAQGSRVESFINGVAAAHVDDAPPSGPLFALQAHYPGSVVHFRNLTIEAL